MSLYEFHAEGDLEDPPPPVPHTTLWKSGVDGYHTYRIPALVVTDAGTLLAFCEGRRGSSADAGDIDLITRRSSDGGRTWSETTSCGTTGRTPAATPVRWSIARRATSCC
jgi:sialidase-1